MSEAVAELLEGYLALTEEEKNLFDARVQTEYDPVFAAELDRRIEAVGNGTAVLLDGEECFRQLRENLRRNRGVGAP